MFVLLSFSLSHLDVIIGFIVLIFAYFVRIQKKTRLLVGFNEAIVTDKNTLAKVAGRMAFILAFFFLFNGFFTYPYEPIIERILVVTWIIVHIIYVNLKLVPH